MIINKEELLKALAIVKPGLSNKEIIEQSTSFAFIEGRVVTYNDEISLSHPVTALTITGAVKADELYLLLNKIKSTDIEIEIQESEILLKAGRIKAGLTLQHEIKLPLEELGVIDNWKKLPTNFCKHLKFAASCCSNDMSSPILTCVNVKKDGLMEGSDGYKLLKATLNKPMPVNDFLLPVSAAMHVIKLEPTHVATGDGWVHFKAEETILSCRVFEDVYPDVSAILEMKGKEVNFPKTFEEVLDRAAVFSKREHFLDEEVLVTIGENRVKVRGKSDSGWFEESANMKYEGKPIDVIITPYLLRNILKETLVGLVSDKKIKFKGEDWVYVVMLKGV
jgi:DNA polymerase III sliding clamp (beta) subunit (PCNA family)